MLKSRCGPATSTADVLRDFIALIGLLSLCFAEAQSFKSVVQNGHGEVVKTMRYTADGKYLVAGSRDKSAKLREVATGKEVRSFIGPDHTINDLSVSSTYLATSSADGSAMVWDIETRTEP